MLKQQGYRITVLQDKKVKKLAKKVGGESAVIRKLIDEACEECLGYGYVADGDNDVPCISCRLRKLENEDPDAQGDQDRIEKDPNY